MKGIDEGPLPLLAMEGWPLALQAHPFCLQKGTAKKPRTQRSLKAGKAIVAHLQRVFVIYFISLFFYKTFCEVESNLV